MNRIIITWLVIIITCYGSSAQKTYIVSQKQATYSLSQSLEILADSTLQLKYPAVKNQPFILFSKFNKKIHPHEAYWGRLTLQSHLSYDESFVLYLGSANYGEVYIESQQGLIKEKTGRLVPLSQKKIKEGRNAPVPLILPEKSDQQPVTVYFRLRNVDHRLVNFVPVLYTQTAWGARFKARNLVQGIFHAIIWTLIIYQLSLFVLLKYKEQFYAPAYFIGLSVYYASVYGIIPEFFLGEAPHINEGLWINSLALHTAFLYLLIRAFLNTKKHFKVWHSIFTVFIVLHVILAIITLIVTLSTFNLGLLLVILQAIYSFTLPLIT
ncbi:7TM diverse intracellular signaling domain-containing protein [uncultured Microscilla sp.]|uniref:7TM diverse intracellular signaling domain-containing protein n=1 Tax=uncultured Microscilla sp. TaxID=432653 RepID=UPI002637A62D|nr:7TM diverse intracellular signaling domain-containing protein [uncultured Microscilla sp.]